LFSTKLEALATGYFVNSLLLIKSQLCGSINL
jgi:hypothetical protein